MIIHVCSKCCDQHDKNAKGGHFGKDGLKFQGHCELCGKTITMHHSSLIILVDLNKAPLSLVTQLMAAQSEAPK